MPLAPPPSGPPTKTGSANLPMGLIGIGAVAFAAFVAPLPLTVRNFRVIDGFGPEHFWYFLYQVAEGGSWAVALFTGIALARRQLTGNLAKAITGIGVVFVGLAFTGVTGGILSDGFIGFGSNTSSLLIAALLPTALCCVGVIAAANLPATDPGQRHTVLVGALLAAALCRCLYGPLGIAADDGFNPSFGDRLLQASSGADMFAGLLVLIAAIIVLMSSPATERLGLAVLATAVIVSLVGILSLLGMLLTDEERGIFFRNSPALLVLGLAVGLILLARLPEGDPDPVAESGSPTTA